MIYIGTKAPTESTKVVMTGEGTQISTSAFYSSYDKAEYVGYQYIEGQQHGYGKCNETSANCTVNGNTVYNSAIKQAINKWYAGTTLEKDAATKALVSQDQIFCNDRGPSSTQTAAWRSTRATYYYGAYGRLISKKEPQLICPTSSDKYTVGTSNGNGALTYPVGLITADEVAMAGGKFETSNSTYYLYTNRLYWSGSPGYFYSGGNALGFFVNSSGNLDYNSYVDNDLGARPVISLSSKVKLSGSGTYNDVYTVVGGNSTENTSSGKSFDTVFAANNTDIFDENGIRYEGADPNNYICLDSNKEGACSSSSLLFRIIGLFDEDTSSDGTTSAGTKKLLKVIDTNNYGGTDGKEWSGQRENISNNWSESYLKSELNGTYLSNLINISYTNNKLANSIVSAKWHLGGTDGSNYNTLTAAGFYTQERNIKAVYNGNPTNLYAKVGLMYPSDYGYATVGGSSKNKSACRNQALYNWDSSTYTDCKNNDWLFISQKNFVHGYEWLISPNASVPYFSAYLSKSGNILSSKYVNDYVDFTTFSIRPTFYLDSNLLKIIGGTGTSTDPYHIG